MIDSKTSARIAGVLLILGTVPILAAMVLWGQPFLSPDYLSLMAGHSGTIHLFTLAIMVMGLACAGIGISLYPVLKRHNEGLAVTAMGFRIMEGILQVASAGFIVYLLALSQEFVKAGSPLDSFYQPAGAAIKAVHEWMSTAYLLPFCIGASSYYLVFYKAGLIPRWLSVWGLGGILLMLVSVFSGLLSLMDPSSPVLFLLNMPILVQELVLAFWLIVKGYNYPETTTAQSH
ncbi:MAG: hypothetical protein A3J97_02865 [Spirochaetes bacterium RIFOXYC1_FULL_54_7]|nr:MAG: hypothetical protein A3J97_02865 [Spirochaetes bacterium RIFOXYC1_FULL_54_7]